VRWVNHTADRELHVHLMGSARPERLRALAARRGHRWAVLDEAALRAEFRTGDVLAFIGRYFEAVSLVTHPDDAIEILEDLARGYAAEGVRAAEVMVTPHNVRRVSGLDPEPYVVALADACVALSVRHGVALALLLDVVRDEGEDAAREALVWAERFQGRGVAGLALSGDELGTPSAPFRDVWRRARAAGLTTTAHAGEGLTGAHVRALRETLDALSPDRISHGIAAALDRDLLARLRDQGTVLDVCPTSNVCTGAVVSLEAHPLPVLARAGVAFSINTDDPGMFGVTLTGEIAWAHERLALMNAAEV